jgi:hypothetical protein
MTQLTHSDSITTLPPQEYEKLTVEQSQLSGYILTLHQIMMLSVLTLLSYLFSSFSGSAENPSLLDTKIIPFLFLTPSLIVFVCLDYIKGYVRSIQRISAYLRSVSLDGQVLEHSWEYRLSQFRSGNTRTLGRSIYYSSLILNSICIVFSLIPFCKSIETTDAWFHFFYFTALVFVAGMSIFKNYQILKCWSDETSHAYYKIWQRVIHSYKSEGYVGLEQLKNEPESPD